jgi:hypothetical protein
MGFKIEVPSKSLAKAWRAALICTMSDTGRPVLDDAICIEYFEDHGLRLVATDSYILVHAWVGLDPLDEYMEPDLDEVPDKVFVVSDADRRGLGMLKFVEKLYRKEHDAEVWPKVTMTRQKEILDDQQAFEGLEAETLRLEWPDHEEVVLRLVEGLEYPKWREVEANREEEPAELMAFTSHTLGALAKLGEIHKGYSIDWRLSGDLGVVRWTIGPIGGLLMPARSSTTPPPVEEDQS